MAVPVTFESSGMYFVGTTFDTNNKIIICYTFDGAEGRAVVGTVNSGSNTISFGSPVTFLSATLRHTLRLHMIQAIKKLWLFIDTMMTQVNAKQL